MIITHSVASSHCVTTGHIWQHKAKLVTRSAGHIWSQLATTGTTWSHMILSGHRLHYMLTYCDFYPFSNKVQLGNTWSLLVTYRIADITLSWSHLVLSGHILYSIVTSDNIWSILITYYSFRLCMVLSGHTSLYLVTHFYCHLILHPTDKTKISSNG